MSDHIVFCPDFNPRSREGSDFASRSHKHPRQISIHAPAKGATMMSWCWGKAIRFQSTLPRRERLVTVICCLTSGYFNPRSREGSDRGAPYWLDAENHFNPRSREGSDLKKLYKCFVVVLISIHAPAKGATAFINIFSLAVRLFFISSHQ